MASTSVGVSERTAEDAATSRGQSHQTQQDLGGAGVSPRVPGQWATTAQRLRRPFVRRRLAEEGGGIEEQKPSWHRSHIPSQSSLTPTLSLPSSATAKSGL